MKGKPKGFKRLKKKKKKRVSQTIRSLQLAGTWFLKMYNKSSASARNFVQCVTEYLQLWEQVDKVGTCPAVFENMNHHFSGDLT